jgi:ElaB/YqjD/DUF883 family membrane-anchored ribosome-binding protein
MDSHQIKRGIKPASGGSNDSDRILSDIRNTRSRMDHTLDELGDKMQPRHLVEEAVDYFWTKESHIADKSKQSAARMGKKMVEEVRNHPLPSLLIGAGVVWLLAQQRQRSEGYDETGEPGLKEKAGAKFEETKERIKEGAESMKERASEIAGTAKEKLGAAKEKFGSPMEGARVKSAEVKDKTKEYYQRSMMKARQTSDEHPLAVGLACLAAGVIAGVMAPRTRAEDKAFGETADRIREQAKEQGAEIAEKGKHVVDRAVEAGKEEARTQDLTPEGLTGTSEEKRPVGAVQPDAGI